MTTRARARAAVRGMAADAQGPRLRSRWPRIPASRLTHVCLRTVEFVAALFIVGGLALASLLARGPLRLVGMHDQIQTSLQERVGDRYAIALGPTYLMHDSWGVGLGFKGFTVRDAAGRTVLSAPSGKLGLDPFTLPFLDVRVSRLELDGLDMRLRVAADGALSLAVASDSGATPIPLGGATSTEGNVAGLAAFVRAAAETMAGATQALDRLTLANGHFEIDNEATERSVVYKDFAVTFDHSGSSAHARISATGPAGPWTITAKASDGGAPTLSLQGHDLSLADLQAFDKAPPPLAAEGPIAFKLDAELTPESALRAFAARFTVGAGRVRINNPDAVPFFIDEASGAMAWDQDARRFRVDRLQVLAGLTHIESKGWLAPPADAAKVWNAHLESRGAQFGPERPGANPVGLESIVFDARFLEPTSQFIIDGLKARGPTVDVAIRAETAPDGTGSSLKLGIDAGPSATSDLIRLWPQFINPDVREWCAQNLHGGQLQGSLKADWTAADLDAMAHKRGLPRESLHGEFTTRDVGVDLLPGLPIMMTDEGTGSFTGHEFNLSGNRATMVLSPSRRVQANDLAFSIPDTTPRPIVDASAKAHMSGTADALADLLMREPLRRQAGLTLDPATVKGQAEGDLALDLKLGKAARPEDTQFHATGALDSLQIEKFLADEKLDSATAVFEADRNTLKIAGDGELLGAATHVDVARAVGEEGSATVTFALDAAGRAKRGLNFGSWLTGPLSIKLKAPLTRASAEVEIDLTPAGVDNPVPGLSKPAGKPGKATFLVKPTPEGASLSNIAIELGVPMLRGSAQMDPAGAIESATITQARIAPGDDFKVEVVNSADSLKASVRGASLDARAFVKSVLEGASSGQTAAKDFDLDAKIGSVIGSNKQTITNMELTAFRRGGETRLGSLRGRVGGGAVTATGSGGETRIATSDAGALLRFANLYSHLEGGDLNLLLRSRGDASAGEAVLTDFVLRDEPAFRRLVSAGPPGETESRTAPIDAARVRFEKMTASFERTPGKLGVQDAVIYNPNVGLTAQGGIDFQHNQVDLSGSFVPAYTVNTMLTKIPLVGLLLSGGENGGVFGINYRVHGSMSDPTLTVNPLSAIAPGIFHRILSAIDGTTTRGGMRDSVETDDNTVTRRPATR
ncbi:MAG: AsmA-like C-terminal domain-containing protein [Hyphomicrobiales bacterium]|nr:AsmA-like C-terminal domain-containing protein [Hyphomicrobiales bacterium]